MIRANDHESLNDYEKPRWKGIQGLDGSMYQSHSSPCDPETLANTVTNAVNSTPHSSSMRSKNVKGQ